MIVKDDYSRFTKLYFLRTKDEAERFFAKYLAEISPRKVEVVRSDDGGEFTEGEFGELCDREKINPFGTGGDLTLRDYKGCWMPFRSVRKLPEAVVPFTEP